MKLPFHRKASADALRMPAPPEIPQIEGASLAALYRAARTGGDFFDFKTIHGRLIFLLLDIAGRRDQALNIAAAVQEQFRAQVVQVFSGPLVNEADALSEIAVQLNRTIMESAGGVRCAPAFVGSYDEDVGILFYINAGHTPALLRDTTGVQLLSANGLPFGLFSHATHDAQTVALSPGAAILLVSKGLVESRRGRQEFGLERLQQSFDKLSFNSASELCSAVLTAVEEFTKNTPGQNDITAVALMRAHVAVEKPVASAAAVS